MPVVFLLLIVVAVVVGLVLRHTPFGVANQFGISNYLTVAIWGAILIAVVVAQTLWTRLPPLRRRRAG